MFANPAFLLCVPSVSHLSWLYVPLRPLCPPSPVHKLVELLEVVDEDAVLVGEGLNLAAAAAAAHQYHRMLNGSGMELLQQHEVAARQV
jgi:hypothetical protein